MIWPLLRSIKPDVIKIAFLNKADNIHLQKAGNEIAALIGERDRNHFHRVIVAELKGVPVIHKCSVFS